MVRSETEGKQLIRESDLTGRSGTGRVFHGQAGRQEHNAGKSCTMLSSMAENESKSGACMQVQTGWWVWRNQSADYGTNPLNAEC